MRFHPLRAFLACLVLLGCGADESRPGGAGGPADTPDTGVDGSASTDAGPDSLVEADAAADSSVLPAGGPVEADYCAPLADLICQRAATCGCGALVPGGVLDVAACKARYTDKCLAAYADVVAAVHAGEARVDPAAAASCIALLDASTPGCEAPRGSVTLGLCPPWFSSDVPLGQPCAFPVCAGGEGYCANGTCAARPGPGAPCQGFECRAGLLCLEGTCRAAADVGESCTGDEACRPPLHCVDGACATLSSAGQPCTGDSACSLGLRCVGGKCTTVADSPCEDAEACGNLSLCAKPRRCQPPGASGDPCVGDEACQSGFGCDPTTSTCTEYPAQGQACQNGVMCAAGLACDMDLGHCEPLPSDGQPCALGPMGPFVCADGLGCNAGTCGALPGEGDPCTVDARCADGLGCDFTAGSTCIVPKDVGGDCQNDSACKPGLHCDFATGHCAADYVTGAPCKDGNECGPGATCALGPDGGFACAPLPDEGEACLFDCRAGLTCIAVPAASKCLPQVCLTL